MDKALYSSAEGELVFDWREKWIKLIGLINEVTGTDEAPWSPPPPTDLEELQYQGLRFWFIDHQANLCHCGRTFASVRSGLRTKTTIMRISQTLKT